MLNEAEYNRTTERDKVLHLIDSMLRTQERILKLCYETEEIIWKRQGKEIIDKDAELHLAYMDLKIKRALDKTQLLKSFDALFRRDRSYPVDIANILSKLEIQHRLDSNLENEITQILQSYGPRPSQSSGGGPMTAP